jgi:glutaredoxin
MIKKSGQMGVPVIMVDDKMVTGFNQAKLDELLSS